VRVPKGPRAEGEDWEVWLDEDGVLWSRMTRPQHAISAAARVAAMQQLIREHGARQVLIDNRRYPGAPSPAAIDAYRAFLRAHPGLRVAMVTSEPEAIKVAFEVRGAAPSRVEIFKSVQAAKAWLRREERPQI
jgi:hypothetical protein